MRRAMQHLVDKGLVVRRRGIGTRIVSPKVRRSLELSSLFDDLTSSGQRPATSVLRYGPIEADEIVAAALDVPVGTEVLQVERLRSAMDQPIAKLTNYLRPRTLTASTSDLEQHGLYELIRAAEPLTHFPPAREWPRKTE